MNALVRAARAAASELVGMFLADRVLSALVVAAVVLAAGLSLALHAPSVAGAVLVLSSLGALVHAVLSEAARRRAPVPRAREP